MRNARVWQRVLGLARTVIETVVFDEEAEAVVVSVRPRKGARRRCGRCGRRAPWFDRGEGRRRWRALDLGTVPVFLEADAPRVNCPTHGPTVIQVPWARHGVGHTRDFDETVAWLATQCSKTAVVELMRIAWRTVGSIVARVSADIDARVDRLAGLRRIGIDEISYKRGHRYLIVVVDHDTGALVWAAPGRDEATLRRFFDALGDERAAQITHVSADAADWIATVVTERCPNAVQCADAFHVVAWATEALDEVRRQAWNEARGAVDRRRVGRASGHARALKRARYALWKNPENLTDRQRDKLAWIAKTDPRLHRAYLLKEGLRMAFVLKGQAGKEALDRWISWARRCRIPAFVALQRRIVKHRAAIDAALDSGLSNALIESTNTKIRLITRVAFGFHSAEALIALAMLSLGGHPPALPGRP
ncbi:MAG TPA: ISL3 family transposase [Acidimicrobiales bacterium]|nr:ISL3 family transposase [Acidimicrobiales bacterium]